MTDLVIKAQGQEWPLDRSRTYTVGRDPAADIPLQNDLASKTHLTLSYAASGWVLTDRSSTNGTFVGGQKVGGRDVAGDGVTLLSPGMVVLLGDATNGARLDVAAASTHAGGDEAPTQIGGRAPTPPAPQQPAPQQPAPQQPAPQQPAAWSPPPSAPQQGWAPPPPNPQQGWAPPPAAYAAPVGQTRPRKKSSGLAVAGAAGVVAVVVVIGLVLALVVFKGGDGSTSHEAANDKKSSKKAPVNGPIVGDVNGDHKGDITVALNEGTPRFYDSDGTKFNVQPAAPWASWGDPLGGLDSWLSCDFDGDGKADIGRPDSDLAENYEIHLQSGAVAKIPMPADYGAKTYCGDFNGDKLEDVAFATQSEDEKTLTVSIAEQTSRGRWSGPVPAYTHPKPAKNSDGIEMWGFYVGDFDGDGKTDMLYEDDTHVGDALYTATMLTLKGTTFQPGPVMKVTQQDVTYHNRSTSQGDQWGLQGVAADIDGDGTDEWVRIGNYGWYDVYKLTDKKWVLKQQTATMVDEFVLSGALATDVNGDHFVDVVGVSVNGLVAVYLGSEHGLLPGKLTAPLASKDTEVTSVVGVEPTM